MHTSGFLYPTTWTTLKIFQKKFPIARNGETEPTGQGISSESEFSTQRPERRDFKIHRSRELRLLPIQMILLGEPIAYIVKATRKLRFVSNPLKCLTRHSKRRCRGHRSIVSTRYHSMMSELCSKPDQELFTYTSGRYLYNEKLRLTERHVHFDVLALKNIAADYVDRRSVIRMEKLTEGGFSRVFLLTMDDRFEVIAKLLYSLTVPKHFTTESEVVILDFLSSKGVPVPRVYAWSSEGGNAVGLESIIMEKAPGQSLESRWFSLI